MLLKLEKRGVKKLSRLQFGIRVLEYALVAFAVDAMLMVVGATGYAYLEGMSWLNAALDTAMLITGNGPPREAHTVAGKVFQIVFGLFGVMAFALVLSLILIPILHRMMLVLHLDSDPD
jgi:hypothetical protein